ncbi:MAG: pyruvate dehydrogenase (acetyl-transferring) E1 component subunit alpha [Myxococcaceae bacterium]
MSAPALPIEREPGLRLLGEMIRERRFEERCAELYVAGKIRGFLHLYIGEEAVAAGAIPAIAPDEAIVSNYRDHGHALARGIPARQLMAELFGKVEGCSRGRGGSMHLFDAKTRFYGGSAIVAAGLPVATGLALADVLLGRRRLTACLFGDGAVDEGEFHESMNLAALWNLPVLFLCENNLYAMGTALVRHEAQVDLALKARSYDLTAEAVDGMDVLAVAAAVNRAAASVRRGDGPMFLELRTYRFRAHSMFDPQLYRTKEEVARWMERDPITHFTRRLQGAGLLRPGDLEALEARVEAEVADAVAFAEAGTLEPVEHLGWGVTSREVPR